jgi:AcrR family transcriptional regulator
MGTLQKKTFPKRLERVIDEAEKLFVQEGFLHFSTEQLASRLRCSKRTLYSIAPTREKFFERILERRLGSMNRGMIAAAKGAPNCLAAMCAFVERAIEDFGEKPTRFNKDLKSFSGGMRALNRTQKQRDEALQAIIAEGVKSGAFRKVHPRFVAIALSAAARQVTDPQFLAESEMNWPQALRQIFRLFFQGLLPSHEAEELRERHGRSASVRHLSPVFARDRMVSRRVSRSGL